ncbi:F-box/LRR-repeat protein 2 [Liparis tanakae]|uniref:F-box/LRR-repeat protein 2 n=1 Tax=Liparis tanakae TaxID=230148 RepID=A0A4Z2ITZ8_9TELE|nr:F-box/LRR-repeat protein 2 [Liparis tanakae]
MRSDDWSQNLSVMTEWVGTEGEVIDLSLDTTIATVKGAGRTVSELLKDSGNCRQIKSQELHLGVLSDSLFSEQRKLSRVLDWAHRFLSSGSEVHHQPCSADSLTSADEERWETQTQGPAYMHPPAAKYHQTISCAAGRNLRIANSTLTERWLLCVGRRRPHSLCLYSCSGLSLTSSGLQVFFTLCRSFLKELKVTSCTGPGLHGDQMLSLVGQLCHHVTSVDVGWSGATNTGVKALSDCTPGLQLQSVVLNGCHVTDDPLMKLVLRHKERYVLASSISTSDRSLDVSGCKAVTDAGVQSLALGCQRLQQLNLSSTGTGNRGITLLANYCSRQLQTVKLNFCHVTLETILKLCRRCQRLKVLHLYGCAHLPAEREIREVNASVKVHPMP